MISHIFGAKGESKGILRLLMIAVFFIVGWLEIVSILFRPISLSFRLFGNVYAGEVCSSRWPSWCRRSPG
jgi:F-type H+-transporting ATPase subunit a